MAETERFRHLDLIQLVEDPVILHINGIGLEQLGLTLGDLHVMAGQISEEIYEYNKLHPHEMLPKSPEEIEANFLAGRSLIIAKQIENKWQFLHHCTMYELLTEEQSESLDGWQVIEYGTALTHAPIRAGFGVGKMGAEALWQQIRQDYGEKVVVIATIKQFLTGRMFGHVGAKAARWSELPFIAFLTDSCEGISPLYTGQACAYRRTEAESSEQELWTATHEKGGKMPCTLIVFDMEKAIRFNQMVGAIYQAIMGEEMSNSVDDQKNPELWLLMNNFYSELRRQNGQT